MKRSSPLVLAVCAALVSSSSAAVTMVAEYHLGEAGSLGANNLPLDSSGNGRNFVSQISGGTATVGTTGVAAPGSTAYLDTSGTGNEGWYSSNLLSSLPTDDFAFGIYVRASANTAATQGTIFSMGGNNNAFNVSLESGGWRASAYNVTFIGGTATFNANTWVQLSVIRSGGVTTFYADGVAVGGTYAGAPVNDTVHLSVKPGGTTYFDGQMDEARIVTFTAGESTANVLNALRGVPEPSTAVLGGIGLLALLRRRRA